MTDGIIVVYEASTENPMPEEMNSAVSVIRYRLDSMGLTDAIIYMDTNRIRINIPGVHDGEKYAAEIGRTARLTFVDPDGNIIVDGKQITIAQSIKLESYINNGETENYVSLEFNAEATKDFAEATKKYIGQPIKIMLDDVLISQPIVQSAVTEGKVMIAGAFTEEGAAELAAVIRSGALPFSLKTISIENIEKSKK